MDGCRPTRRVRARCAAGRVKRALNKTVPECRQGAFQQQLERWFSGAVGFRGYFVRSDNQIDFSLFRELRSAYGSRIVVGRENYIFERRYIDTALGRDASDAGAMKTLAEKLRLLQAKLDRHGTKLLLLVGGNKATFFPEYWPSGFNPANRSVPAPESNQTLLMNALRQAGVPVIDATSFLLDRKQEAPFPLYPKSGSHWSMYGGCLLAQEIMRTAGGMMQRETVPVRCRNLHPGRRPLANDGDVAGLANIWTISAFYDRRLGYPVDRSRPKDRALPRIVFIGDSFSWQPLHYLRKNHVYAELDFYFYFRSRVRDTVEAEDSRARYFSDLPREPEAASSIDWERDVFSKDLVIIQGNESALTTFGYGFIERALDAAGCASCADAPGRTASVQDSAQPSLQ